MTINDDSFISFNYSKKLMYKKQNEDSINIKLIINLATVMSFYAGQKKNMIKEQLLQQRLNIIIFLLFLKAVGYGYMRENDMNTGGWGDVSRTKKKYNNMTTLMI